MKKIKNVILLFAVASTILTTLSLRVNAFDNSGELGLDIYASYLKEKTFDKSVTVAVIDSGVANIDFLKEKIISGYDFFDNDSDPSNDIAADSHGTFIAGIIAEATGDLPVRIMPVRILENKNVTIDNLVKGIRYAVDNGADVLNISVGGELKDCSEIDKAIQYVNEHNATVIVSAGNEKKLIKNYCPAHNESAITVSAVTENNTLAYYSNFGEAVVCCAPGNNIDGYNANGEAFTASGTSFSAAFISAGAAMVKLEHPDFSPVQIKETIISVCADLGEQGKDNYYGFGLPQFQKLATEFETPAIEIKAYQPYKPVSYHTTITFTANTAGVPEGASVHWFIDGKDSGKTGEKYTVKEAENDFIVQAKLIGKDGSVLAESEKETVTVSNGFFARLIAFFRKLFGALSVIEQ